MTIQLLGISEFKGEKDGRPWQIIQLHCLDLTPVSDVRGLISGNRCFTAQATRDVPFKELVVGNEYDVGSYFDKEHNRYMINYLSKI